MTKPLVRVLIADRFDVVRRGVRLLVESRDNCRVVGEAKSGRAALALARDIWPHIAIIDYGLPEMNGGQLAHELRRTCPGTQVLVYTSQTEDDIIADVLRAGVKGFVLKSDTDETLATAVDALSNQCFYFSASVSEFLLERFLKTSEIEFEGRLSHREREVIQLIAEGLMNKQIGHVMDINVKTVESHRARAMHKLKLRTTADVVRYAIRNNLAQA